MFDLKKDSLNPPISEKTINLFFAKILKKDSCWQWIGGSMGNGYGKFQVNRKAISAHRFSYLIHKGKIPEKLVIDHLCRNQFCVNPEHLEAVTQRENLMRGIGPSAINSLKTKCNSGHEYTPENTYIKPNGTRRCRQCHRRNANKYYAQRHVLGPLPT